MILCQAMWNPGATFAGDLIVVMYLLALPSLSMILGAFASRNPLASLGGSREMKLVMAYELPFILAACVPIIGRRQHSTGGHSCGAGRRPHSLRTVGIDCRRDCHASQTHARAVRYTRGGMRTRQRRVDRIFRTAAGDVQADSGDDAVYRADVFAGAVRRRHIFFGRMADGRCRRIEVLGRRHPGRADPQHGTPVAD